MVCIVVVPWGYCCWIKKQNNLENIEASEQMFTWLSEMDTWCISVMVNFCVLCKTLLAVNVF